MRFESPIRLACFTVILLLMMIWEWRQPRRSIELPRWRRWPANLGIVIVDSLVLRFIVPVLAVGAALEAEVRAWGLLHVLQLPYPLAFVLSLLLLDLAIYGQHVMFHKVPLLWRLHRMHHSDTGFDVTTGLRFHPLEIVLSMMIKLAVVVILGTPAAAVLVFEVILNATAMFNHGNVALPTSTDRWLRYFIVTPDMHRVHHSVYREETDSNYGFNLPWWDHLFRTYRAQPRDGHQVMVIGLPSFRDRRSVGLHWLLVQPFLRASR